MTFYSQEWLASLSDAQFQAFIKGHTSLGYHPQTQDEFFISNIDRESHTYELGVQGCLHPDTPIFDPVDGTSLAVFERYVKGEPFNVLALDGQNVVIAKAGSPLQYAKAPMYELSNEVHSIKVTGHHRIWDGSKFVECGVLYSLQQSSGVLLPTLGVDDLSRLQQDAYRSMRTDAGFQDGYRSLHHFYDERSRPALDTDQAVFPLLSDARVPYCNRLGMDDQGHISKHTHQHQQSGHPSRNSCARRAEPVLDAVSRLGQGTSQSPCGCIPCVGVSLAAKDLASRGSDTGLFAAEPTPYPYCPLSMYSHNSVYRITKTEDEVYYDFHVPKYENYYACGLFHHNSGKSGLLHNSIIQDMEAGHAVNVIDPHGDLITNILHHVPPDRIGDTSILDMEDEAHPFSANLFSTGKLTTDMQFSQAVERIMHIFEVLWPDVLSQANLPRYLRMATVVFLANPGRTLVDMYAFLLDDAFRRQMMQAVTDPTVRQFWQLQYDSLPPNTRISRVQPLLGRLEQLFAGRSLVRNIVGQSSSIDFRKAIEQKRIILIKLPTKTAEQDARLIGTILLSQIHAAIFSFGDVDRDKRHGVSLYVDEVQHFATPDFSELFTEGRKFGLRLTIAHQYRGQLPSFLQGSTMTARTKVCFQLSSKDGPEMAHEFPAPEQGVKPEHVDPHPSETLTNHPHLHPPVVQEFIEWYLRPVLLQQVGSHGNKVKINDPGYGLIDAADNILFNDYKSKTRLVPEVENPLVYLDYLLQQVMVTGLYLAPIPPEAVRGFANCGASFWQKVRGMRDDDRLLSADIPDLRIPNHLVGTLQGGSQYWLREPESGSEQQLHFLFHLRITMRYLAENPLGSRTMMSNAEVGKMLNSLPPRAAFVRSGKTVGVIYTHDTPPKLPEWEYRERVKDIVDHTRAVYCRPRAEVEQALWGKQAAPPSPPPAAAPAPPPPAPQDISQAGTQPKPALSGWEEAE